MEYLLTWRMAIARNLLRTEDVSVSSVAERVGYGSASTFSIAPACRAGRLVGAAQVKTVSAACFSDD
jgi:transcriptional regulator GlxA family with amidase domain